MREGTDNSIVTNTTISPGSRLRVARETLQLSQAEVARHLRLSPELVHNIENDDYSISPKFVFIRGYLRSYAQCVSEDPDAIVAAFNELGLREAPSNRPTWSLSTSFINKKYRPLRLISVAITLSVLCLFVIWWNIQKGVNLREQLRLPVISITTSIPAKTNAENKTVLADKESAVNEGV